MQLHTKHSWQLNRRNFGIMLASSLAGAYLTHTQRVTAQSKKPPIRIGVNPWPGLMPLFVAKEKGIFEKNGLEVDLTLFPSISAMMDAFNGNKTDLTGIDPGTLLISAASGIPLKMAHVTDFSAGADAIIAAPTITSLKDFAGKKISVEQGSIGHFLLLKALEKAGISVDQVTLINQTADAALAAFVAGRTDIAVSYEPFITQAIKAGKGKVIFSTKDAAIGPDVIGVRKEYLEADPEGFLKFISSWYQVLDFRSKNLEESLTIEAKMLGITVDELKNLIEGVRFVSDPQEVVKYINPENTQDSLLKLGQEIGGFLTAQKLLTKKIPDLKSLIDDSYIKAYVAKGA